MTIYDVISKWELDKVPLNLNRHSRSSINLLTEDVESCYTSLLKPHLGRIHQSLHTATTVAEATAPAESLVLPLIFSKQIVLPDPLYSILSRKANSTWSRLPESGNNSFSDSPAIYSQWKTYWSTKNEDRIQYLNERLPILVERLLKIRELVDRGFIVLQPWEPIVDPEIPNLKKTIVELKKNASVLKEITERFNQDKYHLGARIGAIGVVAGSDHPPTGLKKGTPMWVGDKTEILLMGLFHSLLSQRLSSNFIETLPGDRVVFDFVRSGGIPNPEQKALVPRINIPNLSSSLWEEIVAIRKDSELIGKFQDLFCELSFVEPTNQTDLLVQEMLEIEHKLREDSSLKKFVKLPFAEMSVGTVVGMASNAVTGSALPVALAAGAMSAAGMFLFELATDYMSKESAEKRKRRDLVVRINEELKKT